MSEIQWKNLDTLASFKKLSTLKNSVDLKSVLTAERIKKFQIAFGDGLHYNYAAKEVDDRVLAVLREMADEAQLADKFAALAGGEVVNTGEKRMALHHLARGQLALDVIRDGKNLREFYEGERKKIADFACKVHSGEIVSEDGGKFTNVCQIGIGGSDLGPRAMYLALKNWAADNACEKMQANFISNVDPVDAAEVLGSLDLARTIFILVSKSGTTQETLENEGRVKAALRAKGLDPSKHIVAVTSETSPLANNPEYLASFYMDDFIGGRFSSTSAVGGVVLSLAFGKDVFKRFLDGAHEADKNAAKRDPMQNAAMLDALIGVFERNVQGFGTTAVLPYSQALSRFPAHLQQMDMESNGKSVNRFGEPLHYETGPVIFGEPGTNGQHSFYQLLHQGTSRIPLQFVGFANSKKGGELDSTKLNANLVAQIVAFALGKSDENPNKNFAGGRPSSLIWCEKSLSPESLGGLLAHFENKVMFQGFLWNVNSFDQEGVQLGKVLTKKVLAGEMSDVLSAYWDFVK